MLKSDLFCSGCLRQLKLTPEFHTSACKTHRANANRTVYTGCNWSGRPVDVWRLLTDFLSHCYSGAVHKHIHMSDAHTHTRQAHTSHSQRCADGWLLSSPQASFAVLTQIGWRILIAQHTGRQCGLTLTGMLRVVPLKCCDAGNEKCSFFVAAIRGEEFFFGVEFFGHEMFWRLAFSLCRVVVKPPPEHLCVIEKS